MQLGRSWRGPAGEVLRPEPFGLSVYKRTAAFAAAMPVLKFACEQLQRGYTCPGADSSYKAV